MYELRTEKNKLRDEYLAKRNSIPDDIKQKTDDKICTLFTSLVTYRYSDVLLMYYPTKNEIDVLPIVKKALEAGKTVAFPCCDTEKRTMEFRCVTSLDQLDAKGAFDIPEPTKDCPLYDPKTNKAPAVCVVPAILYDNAGYRIGYGKGFYDRYLPHFSGTTVGLCYADFILPTLPRGRFDLSVDVIVTEKGVKALAKA